MDSQVAAALHGQSAGRDSIAAALECTPRDRDMAEPLSGSAERLPLACCAELVPLGSLDESGGRVVRERRVAAVRPF